MRKTRIWENKITLIRILSFGFVNREVEQLYFCPLVVCLLTGKTGKLVLELGGAGQATLTSGFQHALLRAGQH